MKKIITFIISISFMVGVSGCGQTGSLYIPDDTQQTQQG